MPTYDYRCKKCDHAWEAFQSIKAEPLKLCPECGKRGAERVIGPGAAVIFRGSGFYQTDYRSDAYKKAEAADKPAGGTCGSGGCGKPECAPASKTATESK